MTHDLLKIAIGFGRLRFYGVPKSMRTKEIASQCVNMDRNEIRYVPHYLQTQEMVDAAIDRSNLYITFEKIAHRFKTPELCEKIISRFPGLIKYIPKHPITPGLISLALKNLDLMIKQ